MKARIRKVSFGALLVSGLLLGTGLTGFTDRTAALPSTTRISAVYKVRFAGLKLGNFHVASSISDGRYSVQGSGKLKFLTGLIFEVSGDASSSGSVSKEGVQPAAFSFNFRTRKKAAGRLVMKFDDGAVIQVASQPPLKSHPAAVPVTRKDVDGVLDPLSALFVATAPGADTGKSACDRRIPVYDGLYRFDLQLSHKKTVRVIRKGKGGYGGPAVICRVRYIPVAGHNPNGSNTIYMSENKDIEVWLIPLPENGMYAPYHVSIPTPYGTAQATSTAFTIETSGHNKVALVR